MSTWLIPREELTPNSSLIQPNAMRTSARLGQARSSEKLLCCTAPQMRNRKSKT